MLRYRRTPKALTAAGTWERRFLLGAVTAGLAWGTSVFLLFPEQGLLRQNLLLFVLLGVSATSVTALAAVWRISFAFLCALLGLLILRCFLVGSMVFLIMAGALILYLILLALGAWRTNAAP